MENQLIREQVFDVLFNYVKRADGVYTESDCATVRDEICLQIDQSQFTADEAEEHINQEVERRIAERMPSEEECVEWAKDETVEIDGGDNKRITFYLMVGAKWLRSRLSQKTEGGGE